MTIGKKLVFGFGIVILFNIGIIISNNFQMNSVHYYSDLSIKRASEAGMADTASRLGFKIYDVIADLIINKNIADAKQRWVTVKSEAEKELKELRKPLDTEDEKQWMEKIENAYLKVIYLVEIQLFPTIQDSLNGESNHKKIEVIDALIDKHKQVIHDYFDKIKESLNTEEKKSEEEEDNARFNRKQDKNYLIAFIQ